MPSIPLRLQGLLFKRELTYRTDAVPTAALNGVRLTERLWPVIRVNYAWENLREDVDSGTILPVKGALPRGRNVTLEIPWEVKGAGIDAPAEDGDLLRACGCTETDGLSLFDYAQASQLHDAGTAYAYAAGMLFKVVGCRGGFRWPIRPGQPSIRRYTMRGFLSVEPAPAALPLITYDTSEPLAGVALTLAVGSWVPRVISCEFIQGVEPQQMDDANDADGIEAFEIGVARPQFRLSARVPRDGAGIWDQAAYDPFADAKAMTSRAINLTQGNVAFNREKLIVTNAYVQAPAPVDFNQMAAFDLVYNLTDWIIRSD
ncbi:MAG: hypothetical protein ACRDGN_18435 [bacterium]